MSEITTMESLAFWLSECDSRYTLARFSRGIGLSMRHGGGCWGILTPELVEKMKSEGYLEESRGDVGATFAFSQFARRIQYEKLKKEFEPVSAQEPADQLRQTHTDPPARIVVPLTTTETVG